MLIAFYNYYLSFTFNAKPPKANSNNVAGSGTEMADNSLAFTIPTGPARAVAARAVITAKILNFSILTSAFLTSKASKQ